jgi:hypothetical protein
MPSLRATSASERTRPEGQLVKPQPRPRYGFEQSRVDLARWFVTRGDDNPRLHAATLHGEWYEAGQTKNAAGPHSGVRTGNLDFQGHPDTVVVQFDAIDEFGHARPCLHFVL